MVIKITCSNKAPPIGGLAVVEIIKSTNKVLIEWGTETILTLNNNSTHSCLTNNDILRALATGAPKYKLYGQTPIEKTQIDHWLTFALSSSADIKTTLIYLDKCLGPITYLVSNNLTIADLALFNEIYTKYNALDKDQIPAHIQRWFNLINGHVSVQKVLRLLPDEAKRNLISPEEQKANERKQEGKFVELPGAEMGKVVVRFPPEASGFLHIGHAKAALLNQYYQQSFEGTLIMRFDDTNPAKENVEFEEVILEDLKMLEVKPDLFTYSSDYFDLMLEYCEKMLKDGTAFVDDTPADQMKMEREIRKDSLNRDNSIAKNFELWNEMLKASPIGKKCCVRAKINMASNNGCLRDPTIYRCKNEPHPRTGTKYKVYPTYDFACPIVDAVENVTHTLRTMEYHDRDDQFYWFIKTLNLRRPYIWEYARLNMTNTVLSKRKLTWFVEEGLVDGWDDPRFPTVRGVLRRGMTVEGLKQFIIAQGSSKSVVFMEWDKIWAINKKIIDPIAPRYTALEDTKRIVVNVTGITKNESINVQAHPKDPAIGNKVVWLGPKILIDLIDAEALKEGENATFINWGNLMIKKINKKDGKIISVDASLNLEDKDFKKTLKLTWLCDMEPEAFTPTYCVYFEHIISKAVLGREEDFKEFIGHKTRNEVAMLGDPELKKLKKGDVIQLQRRGFFKVDCAYAPKSEFTGVETPIVLFSIPDGRMETPAAAPAKIKSITKPPPAATSSSNAGAAINDKITKQGELVRDLKAKKATKPEIDAAVKTLLELKTDYKTATGQDWKPGCIVPTPTPAAKPVTASKEAAILDKIAAQGEKVRLLKTQKAEKSVIDAEIKNLLAFKAEYKEFTGKDWKVGAVATPVALVASLVSTLISGGSKESEVLEKIAAQGEKVRVIKTQKPEKSVIDAEVKILLALKTEYKEVTGKDWKVGATAAAAPSSSPALATVGISKDSEISDKITAQGEKVRLIKSQKAEKSVVDAEVKALLALKAEYKSVAGKDWKPAAIAAVPATPIPTVVSSENSKESDVLSKIAAQGEKVRVIKSQKPEKSVIDAEVKVLLTLKAEYKEITGKDWKPTTGPTPQVAAAVPTPKPVIGASKESEVLDKITAQGEKVRVIKSQKAEKSVVDSEVKILLALKAEYKEVTGKDWKAGTVASAAPTTMNAPSGDDSIKLSITEKINEQGLVVRNLKTTGGSKEQIDSAVKSLLSLKEEYKKLTGTDFPVAGRAPSKPKDAVKEKKEVKPKTKQEEKKPKADPKDDGTGLKKQTRLGLEAKKEENLPDWYSQVLTKGEMIEYYDVSGCYILRHWSFAVWKSIKQWFDAEITKMGVKECYFPMFVSKAVLEKEKDHIADFAPEVAWVTKSGDTDLAEHIAIRPTSETVMYPSYAKWIQSYRDLPLKLNQWNNVVRWEFKHPQPFLRTREFLWQEGHTAFATAKEAHDEVLQILNLYASVYTDLMAIPVIKGRKTEKEKFAGGDYTTTVEAFISVSGRAIQGATSHHLGQNFSKMFDIVFEDPETQAKQFVYQNSWGLTTRTIGVMIMIHADNQGLVLPPRVACIQVVIVPCGITVSMKEEDKLELQKSCNELEASLNGINVKCEGDYRDNYSPGWKFNHWELKGVPIRIELGPKDMKSNQFVAVRRDTGEKITIPRADAEKKIAGLLEDIHNNMLAKATKDLTDHTKVTQDWKKFCTYLDDKNIIMSPFCGQIPCEDKIKADSARDDAEAADGAPSMGAKSLCIPFKQPATINASDKCIYPTCNNKPKFYCLFGRSY